MLIVQCTRLVGKAWVHTLRVLRLMVPVERGMVGEGTKTRTGPLPGDTIPTADETISKLRLCRAAIFQGISDQNCRWAVLEALVFPWCFSSPLSELPL